MSNDVRTQKGIEIPIADLSSTPTCPPKDCLCNSRILTITGLELSSKVSRNNQPQNASSSIDCIDRVFQDKSLT